MNIHPMFVHFPIALLTVYAVLEALTIFKFFRNEKLEFVRAVFVWLGTVASFIAIQTGQIAVDLLGANAKSSDPLLEMHDLWANIASYIFLAIAIGYFAEYVKNNSKLSLSVLAISSKISFVLSMRFFRILLALAGLVAITITGALGGSIVYGPDIDPAARFIYDIFF